MKYCKDCKWFEFPGAKCTNPNTMTKNLVFGPQPIEADVARSYRYLDLCGTKAIYFEPKVYE